MKSRIILSVFLLIIIFACTKDDNPRPVAPNSISQGTFIDSPVSGLRYETQTHNGVTDENGKFNYEEGETVTFYVGDIKLGSATAAEELSPISIASNPNATIQTLEVQNIAAFLQTLDIDGNPDNGIAISPEIAQAINFTEIDFSAPIIQILGEMVIDIFLVTGISLEVVYPESAALHLATTLNLEYEVLDLFSFNFLPTFTNYFRIDRHSTYGNGASIALNWVHEFDSEGILLKSTAYEKYPFRPHAEYYFSNYDATASSLDIQITTYNYYDWNTYKLENYTIKFDENYLIKELIPGEGALLTKRKVFDEYNSENWLVSASIYNDEDQFVIASKHTYDSDGNLLETRVAQFEGTERLLKAYTYTAFGEVNTVLNYTNPNYTQEYEYIYREDKSLEMLNFSLPEGSSSYSFSESEYLKEWILSYNNGYKYNYIYDSEEKIEKEYYDGVLIYNYYYRFEDGYGYSGYPYKWEWHEDGILRERYTLNENYKQESYEYFYDNGNVEYKDFYDEEGNWTYTEFYDEEGNLVNTEYAS